MLSRGCNQKLVSRFCRLHVAVNRRYLRNEPAEELSIPDDEVIDQPSNDVEKERYIESKRNKSRLSVQHRNILHNKVPYSEAVMDYLKCVKYNRRLFGRYGTASGVNPGIMWPTKEDLSDIREYESVAFPYSFKEMVDKALEDQKAKEAAVAMREEVISRKMENLEKWKAELNARLAKKEADVLAAKARKDRLVEEVRRHFGFKVDPRDERFKEMLQQKEKEEKKLLKEAKRKAKEEKALARLTQAAAKSSGQLNPDT